MAEARLRRKDSRLPRDLTQFFDTAHNIPPRPNEIISQPRDVRTIMAEVIEVSSPQPSLGFSNPMFEDELREELFDCLNNIQSNGSFALFEHLSNPPNPGLYLKNGGLIGLPLSERDAKVVVAASHAAPFGKGEQTIVDNTVRKTWELSPSEFEIRNPAWHPFLESIVAKVSTGLGVDSSGKGVSAELYKMLLYDEGAMFKPHQE